MSSSLNPASSLSSESSELSSLQYQRSQLGLLRNPSPFIRRSLAEIDARIAQLTQRGIQPAAPQYVDPNARLGQLAQQAEAIRTVAAIRPLGSVLFNHASGINREAQAILRGQPQSSPRAQAPLARPPESPRSNEVGDPPQGAGQPEPGIYHELGEEPQQMFQPEPGVYHDLPGMDDDAPIDRGPVSEAPYQAPAPSFSPAPQYPGYSDELDYEASRAQPGAGSASPDLDHSGLPDDSYRSL